MTSRVRVALAGGVAAAVALSLGAAVPLVPLLRADYALDQAVRAVALDWRDFGRQRAEERLRLEVAAAPLVGRVRPEDCVFDESAGRRVACGWGVVLRVPVVERQVHLDFGSEAELGPEGGLL